MKRFAAAMVLLAVMAVTAMAAQEKGPGGPEGFGPGHGKGLVMMLESLNLSPDQKHQVAQILKDNREQAKGLREGMKAAHENMREVMDKTPGDEAAVRKAAQGMAKAGEELAVNLGKVKAKIDAVLTPEQKAQRDAKKAEHKDRFKDRMGKHEAEMDDWIAKNLK